MVVLQRGGCLRLKEVEQENSEWRISENGLGAELVRRVVVAEIHQRLPAFFAHASLAELVALQMALASSQEGDSSGCEASLLDCLIRTLNLEPAGAK